MNDMQRAGATALTIRDDQTTWTPDQASALQHLGVQRANRADVEIFFHQCKRTGLDPFARQIYMIERQGKQTIQTGIDGFRLIATRAVRGTSETLGYEDNLWCGEDGVWRDVWVGSTPPVAAKATVLRNGQRFPAIALFDEYAARKRDGGLNAMWASRPAGQLAKCAEALALRKAFPQDLSGLYTADEMDQAGAPEPASAPAPATVRGPHLAAESAPSPEEPATQPGSDAVDQGIKDAWDSLERLRRIHNWLKSNNPQDPRLAKIAQRGQELQAKADAAASEVHEGEIVDETTQDETLPINEESNA
ncbi:phage recombination protein Bet [Nesterenkonia sandarakina]|uniref:Phage recombination protein Bet n=1 Tax=Nesterenkonia sandarakina TaxID=272918 RepID=A0A2T0YJ03_9MICC|nr:phage recombination protein Bet [Nesterenkonia sandarakina]PRZ15175.1 phage recombination protein Bet [Nesterenkonia sandarakina]